MDWYGQEEFLSLYFFCISTATHFGSTQGRLKQTSLSGEIWKLNIDDHHNHPNCRPCSSCPHIMPAARGGKDICQMLPISEKEGRNIEQLMTIKDGGVRKSTHLNDTICGLLGSTWWRVLWLGRPALHALTSTTCLVSTGQPSGWISFSFCSNRSP